MTANELLLVALARGHAAASAAILLILLFRPLGRRWVGAEFTYRLWALVPIAFVVGLFPSLEEFRSGVGYSPERYAALRSMTAHADTLLALIAAGAVGLALLFVVRERRFARTVAAAAAGPAVTGVFWPRVVTPATFTAAFNAEERELIRAHERTHIAERHPRDNLIIAAVQALGWFNPLVHVAAAQARLDQELACDAQVLEQRACSRRRYGEILLKAQMGSRPSPLACALVGAGRHPLELRLKMLARPAVSLQRYLAAGATVTAFGFAVVAAIWALAPSY